MKEQESDRMPAGKTIIVDVRTPEEWNHDGYAPCTVNYPLNELDNNLDSLKGYDNIVVVCRSGSRSGRAKTMLENAGFQNVRNGGAWQSVKCP